MSNDTTAQIKAKGCDGTGITENVARDYYDNLGSHHLAIVEYKVDARSIDSDGHQKVQLAISTIEPITAADADTREQLDEHVRTIQAALYRNRKLNEDGEELPLSDGPEPTVKDVLRDGQALLEYDDEPTPDDPAYEPHDYVDTPDAVCGVCDQAAGSAVHQGQPAMT